MTARTLSRTAGTLAFAATLALALAACGGPGDADNEEPATGTTGVASSPTAEATDEATDGDDFAGVTIPGTGTYAIGTDVPLGGFQVQGEPATQPEGCTWSIVDQDGGVVAENQGVYVFLTDAAEYVTFITDGCPDWEQFE